MAEVENQFCTSVYVVTKGSKTFIALFHRLE